jgi:hypothetical protein
LQLIYLLLNIENELLSQKREKGALKEKKKSKALHQFAE